MLKKSITGIALLVSLCLCLSTPAHASIAYDSKTDQSVTSPANPYSFSHTSAFGGVLIVCIATDQNGSESITGVTYDGVALTKAAESTIIQLDGGGPNSRTSIWYLGSPAVGSNTLTITASASLVGLNVTAVNYTGVDHTTPVSHSATDFSDSGYPPASGTHEQTMATTVTSVNGEVVVGVSTWFSDCPAIPCSDTRTYIKNASETERALQSTAGANPRMVVLERASTGASLTLSDDINTNDPFDDSWSETAVSLTVGSAVTYTPCYFRELTINHGQVTADQTDLPVLFSPGVLSYLAVTGSGGKVQSSNGYDILFFSDSALTTLMAFERNKWVSTTGELIAWFKKSVLSATDVFAYLTYGDATTVTDQSNKTAVYRTAIKGVYHMQDASSPATDSTSNGANGTQSGGVTFGATGQIGAATSYDGSNDTLASSASPFDFLRTDAFSGMAWVKTNNNTVAQNIIGNANNGGGRQGWELSLGDAGTGLLRVGIYANVNSSQYLRVRSSASQVPNTTFKHVAFTYSGNGAASGVKIYVNGSAVATTTEDDMLGANAINGGTSLYTGSRTAVTNFFNGTIDESIIEKTEWSANTISTMYNNQSAPTSFITVGAEQNTGAPGCTTSTAQTKGPLTGVGKF
jgi:hypothetical protein